MTFTFRPVERPSMPLIVGLAGPTKSGKTKSALRLAVGLANGGKIAMINTEGPRGHQYADQFDYVATELTEPFGMKRYEDAIKKASSIKPAVIIIDSMSHAHEGIGGMLDQHESELDRMAGNDWRKRDKVNFAAWVKPKRDEASMINTMLQVDCHIILCFRAKEKLKIVTGKDPIPLGWQPIASDRIHFETVFTLILPPHSKGEPDMSVSELREPFDVMIPGDKQLSEETGKKLAKWSAGVNGNNPDSVKGTKTQAGTLDMWRSNIDGMQSSKEIATFMKSIKKHELYPEIYQYGTDKYQQLKDFESSASNQEEFSPNPCPGDPKGKMTGDNPVASYCAECSAREVCKAWPTTE